MRRPLRPYDGISGSFCRIVASSTCRGPCGFPSFIWRFLRRQPGPAQSKPRSAAWVWPLTIVAGRMTAAQARRPRAGPDGPGRALSCRRGRRHALRQSPVDPRGGGPVALGLWRRSHPRSSRCIRHARESATTGSSLERLFDEVRGRRIVPSIRVVPPVPRRYAASTSAPWPRLGARELAASSSVRPVRPRAVEFSRLAEALRG